MPVETFSQPEAEKSGSDAPCPLPPYSAMTHSSRSGCRQSWSTPRHIPQAAEWSKWPQWLESSFKHDQMRAPSGFWRSANLVTSLEAVCDSWRMIYQPDRFTFPSAFRQFVQQSLLTYLKSGPSSWIRAAGLEKFASAMEEPRALAFYGTLWNGLGDGLR